MDARIREERRQHALRYTVEVQQVSIKDQHLRLLADFPTLESAIAWCLGRNFKPVINVDSDHDRWLEAELIEISN